ncbi:twin-arginine translocation signal domain-containing protein [Natrinema sp. HArc-T2]|uniref:twin-arginine translocation signal domain-containing protein n=1 Tax=Natrinema sp. HArc-T2 TaxID=3242701 RepID=UPI00359DC1C7
MAQDNPVSRRTALKLTGAAASTALIAGCSGGGNGNGNGNGNGGSDGPAEIESGAKIEFDGQTGGWEGLSPSSIEGATNPTLVLTEGETYEMGWTTGDGAQHNIEIRNDSGDVVNDLKTEGTSSQEPEDQWLEFEASSDMTTYICEFHTTTMVGELQVESGSGSSGNESSE